MLTPEELLDLWKEARQRLELPRMPEDELYDEFFHQVMSVCREYADVMANIGGTEQNKMWQRVLDQMKEEG